jgi:(p)ppGpp synthase/HD superfamily hydrolase
MKKYQATKQETRPVSERVAERYASHEHGLINQKRKYTGEPYIVHPKRVAEIVKSVTTDKDIIAAAYLHDVVEDTPRTIEDIEYSFGKRVAQIVEMVTDVSKPEDGNRKTRKEIDRQHLAKADYAGQTVKLADMIDNAHDISKNDPNFAKVYMSEIKNILPLMTKGDKSLFKQLTEIINSYYNQNG